MSGDPLPIGTVASYSCVTGYEMTGNIMRTCLEGTGWTESLPVCNSPCHNLVASWLCTLLLYLNTPTVVDCRALNVPNGQVDTSSGTTYNQVATYICNTGYNLVGSSTRTCQANAMWSSSAPVCECEHNSFQNDSIVTFSFPFVYSDLSKPPSAQLGGSHIQWLHCPQRCGIHSYLQLQHWSCISRELYENVHL